MAQIKSRPWIQPANKASWTNLFIFVVLGAIGAKNCFYVIGYNFVLPVTSETYIVSLAIPSCVAFVTSVLVVRLVTLSIYLLALAYSFAFFVWALFCATSGVEISSLFAWFGIAVVVYTSGLFGAFLFRKRRSTEGYARHIVNGE